MKPKTVEEYQEEIKQLVREAIKQLLENLNVMGFEDEVVEAIVEVLGKEHRTIQANFVRTLARAMEAWAKECRKNRLHDDRNIGAITWVEKACEEGVWIPYI